MKSILNKMNTGKWRIFNFQFSILNFLIVLCIFAGVWSSCEDDEGGVRELVLNQTELSLARESEEVLIATPVPFRARTGIVWTSSDESIATVMDGTVLAKAVGKAIISATSTVNPNIKATCELTVGNIVVKDIKLDSLETLLYVDSVKTIGFTVQPKNVDNPGIIWTSSNEKVLSVDQQGTVKGISPGESDITIASLDGAFSTTVHFTVETYIPVIRIQTDLSLIVFEGVMKQIVAAIEPANASRPALKWSSSNPEVVTVSASGMLEGIREGTAVITIAAADLSVNVNVEVRSISTPDIRMNGYSGANIQVLFEGGASKSYPFEYGLGFYLAAGEHNKIIRTITLDNGTVLLVGRSAQEQIRLLFNEEGLTFRDADNDGFIPVGTIAEFDLIKSNTEGSYKLTSDLDFNNGAEMNGNTWEPIGSLQGVIDGDGHKLHNLRIMDEENYTGLVRFLQGGTLKNLHIASGSIETTTAVTGSFIATLNDGIISGCSNNATITSVMTGDRVGGICGEFTKGTISQCSNTGNITTGGSPNTKVGGIAGAAISDVSIIECFNTGDITAVGTAVGGICGTLSGTTPACSIVASYNTGTVTGTYYCGGIVGDCRTPATYTECYNIGAVIGTLYPQYAGWYFGRYAGGTPPTFTDCFYKEGGNATILWGGTMPAGVGVVKSFDNEWPSWSLKGAGGHWKSLGSSGSGTFPQLWYE